MAEQLIITLPDGITRAALLAAIAVHKGYRASLTTQQLQPTETVADRIALATRIDEIKAVGGVYHAAIPSAYGFDISFTLPVASPNPESADAFALRMIDEELRALLTVVLTSQQMADIEAAAAASKRAAEEAVLGAINTGGSVA